MLWKGPSCEEDTVKLHTWAYLPFADYVFSLCLLSRTLHIDTLQIYLLWRRLHIEIRHLRHR